MVQALDKLILFSPVQGCFVGQDLLGVFRKASNKLAQGAKY